MVSIRNQTSMHFFAYTIRKNSITMKTSQGNVADNQETFFYYTLSLINGKWKLRCSYGNEAGSEWFI